LPIVFPQSFGKSKAQANALKQKDRSVPTTTATALVPEKNNTPPLNNIMHIMGMFLVKISSGFFD
jgi:hypothetical protein